MRMQPDGLWTLFALDAQYGRVGTCLSKSRKILEASPRDINERLMAAFAAKKNQWVWRCLQAACDACDSGADWTAIIIGREHSGYSRNAI